MIPDSAKPFNFHFSQAATFIFPILNLTSLKDKICTFLNSNSFVLKLYMMLSDCWMSMANEPDWWPGARIFFHA